MAGDSKARKLVERMRDKQSGGGKPGGKPPAKASPTKAVEVAPVPALEQAAVPAPPVPRKLRRKGPLFRLPHGSGFWTAYDGESQEWTCLLTVPGLPPFTVRAKSLHAGFSGWGSVGGVSTDSPNRQRLACLGVIEPCPTWFATAISRPKSASSRCPITPTAALSRSDSSGSASI